MRRFDYLLNRLSRLEPATVDAGPWPPAEGTMGYLLYQDLGQPAERMGFMEMYLLAAERFYEA